MPAISPNSSSCTTSLLTCYSVVVYTSIFKYHIINIFQISICVLALCRLTTSFVLTDHCSVPPPCKCDTNEINCEYKNLPKIPHLTTPPWTYGLVLICFGYNQFTVIPAGAFRNLSPINETSIFLYLDHNNITTIEPGAFDGIETAIEHLDLSTNRLTHVPTSLGVLTVLSKLIITANPISSIDATLMSKIGPNLQEFFIDVGHLTSLTNELQSLHNLTKFSINYIPLSRLNDDIFNGLISLQEFEMSYSKLEKIPAAICSLRSVRTVVIKSSINLRDDNSPELCNNTVTTLYSLILSNNSLTTVPNVFRTFPNLQSLYLDHNNLSSLSSVTQAVHGISRLREFDITGNKVVSIGDDDLVKLPNLFTFTASDNPLTHISTTAFKTIPYLYDLELDRTKLTKIPDAVLLLRGPLEISLDGAQIECSCSAMAHLKHWNISYVLMQGDCKGGLDLRTYYENTFQQCQY